MRGKPRMRRLSGGEAERTTEMEATQVHERRQFRQRDLFIHMIVHVARHDTHLPASEPTHRVDRRGQSGRGVRAHELYTQQIQRVLDEKNGARIRQVGLLEQQPKDRRRDRVCMTHSRNELDAPTAFQQRRRAALQPVIGQVNVSNLDRAGQMPAAIVIFGQHADGSRSQRRMQPLVFYNPAAVFGTAVIRADQVSGESGDIAVIAAAKPWRTQAGAVAEHRLDQREAVGLRRG